MSDQRNLQEALNDWHFEVGYDKGPIYRVVRNQPVFEATEWIRDIDEVQLTLNAKLLEKKGREL